VTSPSFTIALAGLYQPVAFAGAGLTPGDSAKWVRAGSDSCDSANDATTAEIMNDDLSATFYFGAAGPLLLCYKFAYNGTRPASAYTLFGDVRAAALRFDTVSPRATAVNCSSSLTL
jgi:hypothetical protein